MPASSATLSVDASLIVALRHFVDGVELTSHPTPGIDAADDQSTDQQRQRPGVRSGMTPIQPRAQQNPKQRRQCHGPADQSHHAEAPPDRMLSRAPRLQLVRRFGLHLPEKFLVFIAYDATRRGGRATDL